jgi:predicted nucleotidyltransferase
MRYHGVEFDQQKIAAFCRKHGISRLSIFGSILRDDFSPDSDIDVLVEFSGPTPSLLELGGMQVELTALLGREVDLKTAGFLSPHFRDQVLREAWIQYAA